MKTFNFTDPEPVKIPDLHVEVKNSDPRERSACSACPDVEGGWPCPTLREHWDEHRAYVWSLRDALLERAREMYSERMEEFARQQEDQGRPDGARRARERAKHIENNDDSAWTFLNGHKEIFEVPGFGHYQTVTSVSAYDLNTEWSDWSSPVGLVITELLKDENSDRLWNHRYFMITGKNRSHYGTEWDYAQFSEVKPKPKIMMTWEGVK